MLPSRALSLCVTFIIWCSVAERGHRGQQWISYGLFSHYHLVRRVTGSGPAPLTLTEGSDGSEAEEKGVFIQHNQFGVRDYVQDRTVIYMYIYRLYAVWKSGCRGRSRVQRQKRKSQRASTINLMNRIKFSNSDRGRTRSVPEALQRFVLTLAQFSQQLQCAE